MFNSTSTLFTMDIYRKYIKKDASDKILCSITLPSSASDCGHRRETAARRTLISFPIHSGILRSIYPGILSCWTGTLWKKALKAAVWTAIATIPLGVLFKVCSPGVAFQLRAGYIFIILFTMFVLISLLDKKFIDCELPAERDCKTMLKWAKILGFSGLFFILAAAVVVIWGALLPETANPDNHLIAYLNDIGFQAFFFFGVLVGSSAVWLYSNANDPKRDKKALPVDLTLFHTSKAYNWGALGIAIITILLYALFW